MVKNAVTRFGTKSLGVTLSLLTITLITYYLDVFQLAVWGVANSLIYIFSQISSLGYAQFIEKFFPNYDTSKRIYFLSKYIKTIFCTSIIWFILVLVLGLLGYFDKYEIENEIYLYIMISILTVVETSIEILNKFFTSIRNTINVDISSLFLYFMLRALIFLVLLLNGYSVFYLVFFQLVLRIGIFFRMIFLLENNLSKSLFRIYKSNIFKNNFLYLSYTFKAFALKTLNTTFLNLLFLIFSINNQNNSIAVYSICILVINSARPVFSSISGLLFPIISKNIKSGKSNLELMKFIFKINSLILGTSLSIVYIFLKINLFSEFFINKFEIDFRILILISLISSTIPMFYLPSYFDILFSNNEDKLLSFSFSIYFVIILIFTIFIRIDLALLICYSVYELSLLFFTLRQHKLNSGKNLNLRISKFSIVTFSLIFVFNLELNLLVNFLLFVVITIFFINDVKLIKSELSNIKKTNK